MSHRIVSRSLAVLTLITLTLFASVAAHAQKTTLTVGLAQGFDANGEPQYTATVTNTGALAAANVTVTYTMPVGELPISPSPSGGCLFTLGSFHLTAVCTLSTLGAGQPHDFVVAIHPVDTAPQDVTAVAQADNADPVSDFTTRNINEVGLTEMLVTMTSTNPGKVGENLVYIVNVTNIQDDDARNVFAVLALPKGTTFVSATKGCTRGTLVTCKLGQMSPGTTKTVTITVLPTISGWTQATAGVRLTTPDRDPSNNSAATSIWINP